MRSSISRVLRAVTLGTALVASGAAAQAKPDSARHGYVAGDVAFMTGMIGHHSQAVLISSWAPTHGASPSLLTLCERIKVGQQDEIELMQNWLRDRGEPVPDTSTAHMMMPGMEMHMPGMLNAAQLDTLNSARGPAFDRYFLTYMIHHHEGAIVMVDDLFATEGAGQDEPTFRLASNIYADQTTEIARMEKMLAALPPAGGGQ